MDVLILGNSFDLAHGLKTSYGDVLNYFEHINDNQPIFSKIYNIQNYDTNLWLKHFTTEQEELGENWIDLEEEIYNVLDFFNQTKFFIKDNQAYLRYPRTMDMQTNFKAFRFEDLDAYLTGNYVHNQDIEKGYRKVISMGYPPIYYLEIINEKGFIQWLYDELREFTFILQSYLTNIVIQNFDKTFKHDLNIIKKEANNEIYVLNFNYTNTIESLYGNNTNIHFHSYYVHGQIKRNNNDNCNLVFGTKSFNNNISRNFNAFQKHNQRYKYETINDYQNFVQDIENPIFHIIGHSLSESDHNILKNIFKSHQNAQINIYYHKKEEQEKLLNNITNIIGEEAVMNRVKMFYLYDERNGIFTNKHQILKP